MGKMSSERPPWFLAYQQTVEERVTSLEGTIAKRDADMNELRELCRELDKQLDATRAENASLKAQLAADQTDQTSAQAAKPRSAAALRPRTSPASERAQAVSKPGHSSQVQKNRREGRVQDSPSGVAKKTSPSVATIGPDLLAHCMQRATFSDKTFRRYFLLSKVCKRWHACVTAVLSGKLQEYHDTLASPEGCAWQAAKEEARKVTRNCLTCLAS